MISLIWLFVYPSSFETRLTLIIYLYSPVLLQIAVLISAGFLVCWTPYSLVSLWSIFRDSSSIPPEITLLPCMFAKSSTVYNPLIYYFFSRSFRAEVNKLRWLRPAALLCPMTNSINDNSIYMVSSEGKHPAAQPYEPECTETMPTVMS